MGSCLSAESRSPLPGKSLKKRPPASRNSSFDQLHRIPGRLFLNGSSQAASLFTQQGKKGTNQDAMIVWENFGSRPDTTFCGVFDGHGPYGHMVAKRVRDSLPVKLSAQWEVNIKSDEVLREISLNTTSSMNSEGTSFLSADEESRPSVDAEDTEKQPEIFHMLKESFLKAFKVMDRELKMYTNIDCFCSGTTAVTLVKQGQHLVIGNVGDSRAVLGTRDKDDSLVAVQLTVDLKPNLPAEAERIRKCKGRVFSLREEPEVARVWLPNNDSPGLAMARAFGDFCLKDFGLISVPEISYRCLTEKDEFVILATDGIWDVLSNQEVVEIVASASTRSAAARVLVESAVRAWRCKYPTSKVDDCAVVCLFFETTSSSTSFSAATSNAKCEEKIKSTDESDVDSAKVGPCDHSGTGSGEEIHPDEVQRESGTDWWSALEGVSRVNTLLNLPRFDPAKEEKKALSETKARKS
ncbi:Phosphoprotein phosphatase [Bertholletia excelsa]